MRVNVFETLAPDHKRKKVAAPPPEEEGEEKAKADPRVVETPKFWIACTGPAGGNRVGDVQVSFALVKVNEIKRDQNLAAAKGRSTDVDRPEQPSFTKNPTKAAYMILWRQYRLYIITAVCILLSAVYLLLLTKKGLDAGVESFFQ